MLYYFLNYYFFVSLTMWSQWSKDNVCLKWAKNDDYQVDILALRNNSMLTKRVQWYLGKFGASYEPCIMHFKNFGQS